LSIYSDYKEIAILYNNYGHDIKGILYSTNEGQNYGTFTSGNIEKGLHIINFRFEKYLSYDTNSKAIIKSISIENEKKGGSSKCFKCEDGFICPHGN
jgi:hypothetical protein